MVRLLNCVPAKSIPHRLYIDASYLASLGQVCSACTYMATCLLLRHIADSSSFVSTVHMQSNIRKPPSPDVIDGGPTKPLGSPACALLGPPMYPEPLKPRRHGNRTTVGTIF